MQTQLIVYACLLLISGSLFADSEKGGRGVKVLDDAIFETKKPEPNADTVETASGTRRYKGPASYSTTDQEREWADQCSIANEKGSAGFGSCVRKLGKDAANGIRENRRRVQDRMGASTGPTIPLVEEQKKAPVFQEDSE